METFTVEEIVADDRRNGFVSIAILSIMRDKYKDIFPMKDGVATKQVDIEIKFNGVEVSFREFLKHLESSYERLVNKTALELFEDKLNSMSTIIDDIGRYAKDNAKSILGIYDGG